MTSSVRRPEGQCSGGQHSGGQHPDGRHPDGQHPESRHPDGRAARSVEISNQRGLHARASAKFVKCAGSFDAEVTVGRDGQTVEGTSIMGLLALGAGPGSVIDIRAAGPQAEEAVRALADLVEGRFGEE